MTTEKTQSLPIDLLDATPEMTTTPPTQFNTPALQGSRELMEPQASQGPMADAIAWLKAGGTMAELRDMLQLQREYKADLAREAYVAAMAEFKRDPPTILKDKHVFFQGKNGGATTDYWHATLGNVAQAIIEGLAKVNISHAWKPEQRDGRVYVTCTLTHAAGHSESITLDGPPDTSGNKNPMQQVSSTTTLLSRYTLLMATGLAVRDEIMPDDDGRAGGGSDELSAFDRAAEGIDATLLQDARDASLLGWRGLAAWVAKRTEAERKTLEPISAFLKDAALAADEVSNTKGMK